MNRLQRDLAFGLIASLALASMLVYSLLGQEERMQRWRKSSTARQIEAGAQVYSNHCANCHGSNGGGVGELGPGLADAHFFDERLEEVGWQGTLEEFVRSTTASGRVTATRPLYAGDGSAVVMSPWAMENGGPLRTDEIEAVTGFVLNWQASASETFHPPLVVMPTLAPESNNAQAEQGRLVFEQAGCGECHSLVGEPPAVTGTDDAPRGPDLATVGKAAAERLAGYSAQAYLRESVLIPNGYRVGDYPEDVVCGGVLKRSQLDSLVAFLLSLDGAQSP